MTDTTTISLLTRLHARLIRNLEADALLGDMHHSLRGAEEIKAVADAIRALSADRGEAVAEISVSADSIDLHRTDRRESRFGNDDALRAHLGLGLHRLYAATPPSPAESAEGSSYTDRIAASYARSITEEDARTAAAPSGVSDALHDAVARYRTACRELILSDGIGAVEEIIGIAKDALSRQPQPGRVEGMDP